MDWKTARPVFEATYRLLSQGGGYIDGRAVNEELGRSADDESTGNVLGLLTRTGYINAEFVLNSALPVLITPTEKGLQQAAGWPQEGGIPEAESVVPHASLDFEGLDETDFEEFCFE